MPENSNQKFSDVVLKKIEECKQKKLEKLDLSGCGLELIPEEVFQLHWLTEIDFSGNDLFEINGLEGLPGLNVLDLSGNGIISIWPLEWLSNLSVLNLSRNWIYDIGELERCRFSL